MSKPRATKPASRTTSPRGAATKRAPLTKIKVAFEGETVFSPFSGKPAFKGSDYNAKDPTLLLVHTGDAGSYGYVCERLLAGRDLDDVERKSPAALCKEAGVSNVVLLEIDAGWNGIDTYAFAPAP